MLTLWQALPCTRPVKIVSVKDIMFLYVFLISEHNLTDHYIHGTIFLFCSRHTGFLLWPFPALSICTWLPFFKSLFTTLIFLNSFWGIGPFRLFIFYCTTEFYSTPVTRHQPFLFFHRALL
jgi:hypothetical protein